MSGGLALYVYHHPGRHGGPIWFRRLPRHENEISAEGARKLVEVAMLDGKEVRIVNRGDLLVFHFTGERLLYPATGAQFWGRVLR